MTKLLDKIIIRGLIVNISNFLLGREEVNIEFRKESCD